MIPWDIRGLGAGASWLNIATFEEDIIDEDFVWLFLKNRQIYIWSEVIDSSISWE